MIQVVFVVRALQTKALYAVLIDTVNIPAQLVPYTQTEEVLK